LFTDYDLLKDALERASFYGAGQEEKASLIERFMRNVNIYNMPGYRLLFVFAILLVIISVIIRNDRMITSDSRFVDVIFGYVFVLLIPFIIFTVFGNGYSYEHSYMAHRQLAIAVVAFLCIVRVIVNKCIIGVHEYKAKR